MRFFRGEIAARGVGGCALDGTRPFCRPPTRSPSSWRIAPSGSTARCPAAWMRDAWA